MALQSTKIQALALIFLAISACGQYESPNAETEIASDVYRLAVESTARSQSDRERDQGRKPADILAFSAIQPGMTVLDMYSGGGYYTEMLSYIVGPDGHVDAHTNIAYADFVGEEATRRYADNRLPNVRLVFAENDELVFDDGRYDAIVMVLAYHDIYLIDPENDWPEIDGSALRAEWLDALNPGGTILIVDHAALAGAPPETGGTLHRIDEQLVIEQMQASGFVLDAQSDILRNAEDDRTLHMRDPKVVGKTDRFVLRFKKPE